MKITSTTVWVALLGFGLGACNDTDLSSKPDPPVAIVTGADSYAPLDTAVFDGSASHAQEGAVITDWEWEIVFRPDGSTSQIVPDPEDPTRVRFWVDLAGDYVLALTVVDDRGLRGTTEYPFQAVPWQKIHVSLVWDKADTDLDLHFVSEGEGGTFFEEPFDCFFQNTNPDWGEIGSTFDDPSIDIDDVDGFGPENAGLNQPLQDHQYRVLVHYYDDFGNGSTQVTVRIFILGELRYEGIMPLDGKGAAWDVATIHWPSGEIKEVGNSFIFHQP